MNFEGIGRDVRGPSTRVIDRAEGDGVDVRTGSGSSADLAAALGFRVLLLSRIAGDRETIQQILDPAEIVCVVVESAAELCRAVGEGAGLLLLSEESIAAVGDALAACLDQQPVWSDLPVLVLTNKGPESAALTDRIGRLGNVTVVERPLQPRPLLSLVRSSLRARARQYEMQAHLAGLDAASDLTERHRAAEALRESESRYRSLFESMDEGYCIIEVLFDRANPQRAVDYRFVEVNRAFESQAGMHNVVGRRMLEYVDRIESHWLENYGRVALTGEPTRFSGEYTGLHRWFEVFAFRVGLPGEHRIAVLFTDITLRKRAEADVAAGAAALDRQQRLYEAILNNTPDLAYVFDLNHRFTYANEVLLKMWGRTWEEAIGKNCLELGYEPWHAEMHDREIEQVVATKQPIRGVVPFNGAFGRRLYDYIFVPVLDEQGRVEAVAGTTRDVTDMRNAEAALRESQERLALAISAAELGTFYCPMPLGEIVWNDTCKAHFWLPPDAAIDFDRFYSIINPEDREATRAAVDRAVFEREPYDVEYRTVAPDGRQRWIRAKGRAYYDAAGKPTRFDGITLDISAQKAVEAERERLLAAERAARAEAERAGQIKDEFLATLSHELRTPLNAIVGWSQIIRASPHRPQDVAEGIEVIERNARAQTQIIEDLLDMSRIINGKLRLEVQRIDLGTIIREAARTVAPAADAKEIRVQLVLDPLAGPVSGDPNRLQQVFWNLLSNSIKFSPRGARVQVVLERIDSHVEVSVIDTGEGIGGEFLPHVFDRFRQADASTTRRHGGLGLGLAIVKQLVELHGGSIRAKSAGVGQGSTFVVILPLTAVHPEREPLDDRRHPRTEMVLPLPDIRGQIAGARVLVVDDEADARAMLQRLLEACGAKVSTASTCDEAFALLQQERPDVLVSDIGMQNEDGYALIGRVRAMEAAQGGKTPAIALTAYARSEDRVKVLSAGFQYHLSKPVEPAELIAIIVSLFKGR